MLVTGLSNKEISAPLGIVERTVKAHIAKMMRKVGVHNRIESSVHAVSHSLVSLPANFPMHSAGNQN
jgi:DNA-binding NarL/FixJ family response regulator